MSGANNGNKRARGNSDTEWETTTVRSAYSMGSPFTDHCHEQMLQRFDYVPPATSMGTEQHSKNLTCHICGTHSEKKKSVCFYTCQSRTCQKTRDGVDGLSVCGSESCLKVMESFFGFKCPKCSSLCCCVKEDKEWKHKHEPSLYCPCKNKRGLEDRRGVGASSASPLRTEPGGAVASVSSDGRSVSEDRLSNVEEQANLLKKRQEDVENSVKNLATSVSRIQMTNVKLYEGRILERIQKFQHMEKDPNWINDPAQREQALHRLRHIMSDTDLFVQEVALLRTDVGESNEEKIRRTREEPCLFDNSPTAVLQWAQAKIRTIEEASNRGHLEPAGIGFGGSPIGADDRQDSGYSID